MRALLYTHTFAPLIGGAEKYIMLLAQGLATATNHQIAITVATPTPARAFDDWQLPFKVVRQPGVFLLARLVLEADLVHLSGPCLLPLILGCLLRKPVVIEHHGYTASCPNGLLFYEPAQSVCPGHFLAGRFGECLKCNAYKEGWLKSLLALLLSFPRRWLCKRASLNAPITQHVLKRLALPRSHAIYYGIPDLVCGTGATGAHRPKRNPLCFAYVGRLVPLKGLSVLMQAARIIKEEGYIFHLKVIGDGPERASLESLVKTFQLNALVDFRGFTSGDALQKEMDNVSAVIMPSIWEETAGLAAIEQMMRGRLVIASDIGGLGEVVGECALKCTAGNPASLADCMKQVLDDPGIVDRIGVAARTRALSLFLQERMVNTHIEVYQNLAASRGPR